jgi:hypothetical protein
VAACEVIKQEVIDRCEAGEITHEKVSEAFMELEMALQVAGVPMPE